MKFVPYPFQRAAVDHAVQFLSTASAGQRKLYAAPTGCGKSVVELLVQERMGQGCWVVTPREEIALGMLDKLGVSADVLTDEVLEAYRISTPVRLRNRLLYGRFRHPTSLIIDESHHHTAETWQQLDILSGLAPAVGYTATPYRGTPSSTRELLERWGQPLWLIDLPEAVAEGYVSSPSFSVLPLVDDDIVEIRNGEFSVESIESATVDRLGDLVLHARDWYKDGLWDQPTVFAMPSRSLCQSLRAAMAVAGLPVLVVDADTPRSMRAVVFQAVEARIAALAHVNIVSEGVDLKLRRLVDCAPTLSPVRFVQQVGRITRPNGSPEYIGTNRNLLRHAYALEGAVPVAAVAQAEALFGPSSRVHVRALGLEALGRFKPVVTKLLSGVNVYLYALSCVTAEGLSVDYCCMVHPTMEPVWATKVNPVVDGVRQWGSWRGCAPPSELTGFRSVDPRELSEKQRRWWDRSAGGYGLDPEQEVTRKSFQVLPVLADLGVRLK